MSAAALKKLNVGNKKQKEEERECTFTPKIGSKSRKMNKSGPSGLKRHEHLYEKAVEQQKKLLGQLTAPNPAASLERISEKRGS